MSPSQVLRIVVLSAVPTMAMAQSLPRAANVGDTVRVEARHYYQRRVGQGSVIIRIEGRLDSIARDTAFMSASNRLGGAAHRVPIEQIRLTWVAQGTQRKIGTGALVGFPIGMALALAFYEPPKPGDQWGGDGPPGSRAEMGVVTGLTFMVLGAALGQIPQTRWVRAKLAGEK